MEQRGGSRRVNFCCMLLVLVGKGRCKPRGTNGFVRVCVQFDGRPPTDGSIFLLPGVIYLEVVSLYPRHPLELGPDTAPMARPRSRLCFTLSRASSGFAAKIPTKPEATTSAAKRGRGLTPRASPDVTAGGICGRIY